MRSEVPVCLNSLEGPAIFYIETVITIHERDNFIAMLVR